MSFFAGIFAAISAAFAGLFGMGASTAIEVPMPPVPVAEERPIAQSAPAPVDENQVSASASSDADLGADLLKLDAQLKASASDTALIETSLNDKPVAQTE
jgi:hypothetical protein